MNAIAPARGVLDLRAEARRIAPALEAAPTLRRAAIATWRQRMVNEHGSAPVFLGLAAQFEAIGAPAVEVDAVAAMAEEEHRHGLLCASVVEALGGDAIAPQPPPGEFPLHPEVDRLEALARNLISVGCLAETVAVALITAERARMAGGPLRRILTTILADEVGHARLGWVWMGHNAHRFDAAARARLSRYLRVAFAHLEAHEHRFLPLVTALPDGAEQYGLCLGAESRALFADAVEQVIVPRLEALGLAAGEAWRTRAA